MSDLDILESLKYLIKWISSFILITFSTKLLLFIWKL